MHVCTAADDHFEAAYFALESGAHVYVEKPFALAVEQAQALIDLASSRRRVVCAGHQLLRDRGFETLIARANTLGPIVQVDSHFAFQPDVASAANRGAGALAATMIDILPHPLYALIAAMQQFAPPATPVTLEWVRAAAADLHAILRAGEVIGRLSVSLRSRPIAASLTLTGASGSLTCDFVRSSVIGAGNPGTEPLEKVFNPIIEGLQLVSRSAIGVARRVRARTPYPGLPEMIGAFYRAVAFGGHPPVSAGHLLTVTQLFEELAAHVKSASAAPNASLPSATLSDGRPSTVVTGASGFLGGHVARALGAVRGIARTANFEDPHVRDWIVADLSTGVPANALTGAQIVIHAAAETAGDYDAHRRNTIDATRHLLRAMQSAGVPGLILVSSLSVLRPPRTPWERQDERTPRSRASRRFGPYAWGKSQQEELVEREAAALGIEARVIRPGALVDFHKPTLPGLMGRRLFGRWHLALGRPGLPIAVCDVERCARVLAWSAMHFDETPPRLNLFDPELATRGSLIARMRVYGWTGRVIWVPISLVSMGIVTARTLQSLIHCRMPSRLAAWSVLRPRRYDARLSAAVLQAAEPMCGQEPAGAPVHA